MDNPKRENLLNLALDATAREREQSLNLSVGFDEEERSWEVIVRHVGNLTELEQELPEVQVTRLSNNYAVLVVPEQLLDAVTAREDIAYMEKPKRLFFAVQQGIRASCITPLYRAEFGLSGASVLTAFLDSGIDYMHPDFRNEDGSSRIVALWDQTISGSPPEGFRIGTEYTRETINEALAQPTAAEAYRICPSLDLSGHGTHVAGIAAGNGRASQGRNRGVAFGSELLVVKLGTPRTASFPRTTELMQGLDYVLRKAEELRRPVAVNISFGNNYGSHDGTSLLETYLSAAADNWKTCIVIGTGNEGAARIHTSGTLQEQREERVEFSVSPYETGLNLQIWKSYADEFAIRIRHPNGISVGTIQQRQGTQRFAVGDTELLVYYGEPSPYSPYQEIYLDFLPVRDYVDSGIWSIELVPERIVTGRFDMWLPSGGVLNAATGFLYPTEDTTLTIPSTAAKAISVGAYDAYYDQPAAFSGRGYTRVANLVKPDISAPGVNIESCAPGGGYAVRSGTSMATPFVTGGAALLMEWGIVRGNDPYLYGEKMKAYLIRGARQLPALRQYPNPQLGWGALCVRDSLPG